MTALVLASSSPRRRELLERTGFSFTVVGPTVDESRQPAEAPADFVRRMAEAKANAARSAHPVAAVIVAADTVVVRETDMLGKPRDRDEARAMLQDLSDHWHRVLSGWCVVGPEAEPRGRLVETRVHFKELTDHEVGWYLDTGEWRDKAGAYGIQGRGAFLVDALEGSYSNVVGLPLSQVVDALAELGLDPAPLSAADRDAEIIG